MKKKKLEEDAKKKAAEAKKFDANKLASLIDKAPDDAQQKALLDKDPKKKGQQAAGTSQTATATGKEAGTATGAAAVLSAREQDLLKGIIKQALTACSDDSRRRRWLANADRYGDLADERRRHRQW